MKGGNLPQIEDELFFLSEKELEVIDHLLLFEIKEFCRHITKIKCGRSFSSSFDPQDHIVNVKYWIKSSIGKLRDKRMRDSDDLEIRYVDDLEDYLIYCIKGYDGEIESLSKSQSKHFDQSIPHENPAENTTEDLMQDNNSEKVEETDIEKIDPNPMIIEGIKEDQEVPKTDDLVDDSGINEEDSVEKITRTF